MDEGSEVFLLSTTSGGLRSGKLPSEEPSIPMYSTSNESHQFSLASRMPEGETLDSISVSEEDSQSGPSMVSILCDSLSASSQDSRGHDEYITQTKSSLTKGEGMPEMPEKTLRREEEIVHMVAPASSPTMFVWDLDETLIIFQTLSNGRYAELFSGFKDPWEGSVLGRRWEQLILEVCDDYFFYKQVEDLNEPNLMALQDFDDGIDLRNYDFDLDDIGLLPDATNRRKLAYRHRFVGELYSKGLEKLLSHEQKIEWRRLYEATDKYTDGWLSAGRQLLEESERANKMQENDLHGRVQTMGTSERRLGEVRQVASEGNCNVLVTSGTLIPSLVKCLLFRLNTYFHPLNIYSSREVGKLQCFRWIYERFSMVTPPFKFCAIGDGIDECEAAQILEWPFVRVSTAPSGAQIQDAFRLPLLSMDILHHYVTNRYGLTNKAQ